MNGRLLRTIIILPGTALVVVPSALLWLDAGLGFGAAPAPPDGFRFWLALAIAGIGFALMVWTVTLFTRVGGGTSAPWDPPTKLVVRGPYRHVRNPMITGVLLCLLAEVLLFDAWLLAEWTVLFFAANAVYFPLIEEKGLERRFGVDYRLYKANVPRWLPRFTPWHQP